MPDKTLNVYMDGTLAGFAFMTEGGATSFRYDDSYRMTPGATPLSLSMPKQVTDHKRKSVEPFLQGLLPDNDQALASIARTYQTSARSPFSLLQHIGHDVAGALQFVTPGHESEDKVADRSATVERLSDDDVATCLASVIDSYRNGAPSPDRDSYRVSLAGAQPKMALVKLDDGWGLPRRGVPTTHILKPEFRQPRTHIDERFHELTTVELFSLAVVRHAGLPTPNAWRWESPDGDMRALVVERYDRHVGSDGTVRRLHQEDFCQALSVPPSKKYQHQDGGPGIGEIAQLLRRSVSAHDREEIARDFLALLTLNIALVNTDAHAKNYSVILSGDSVRLAPAYDVLSYALYADRDDPSNPLTFPMRIGGHFRLHSIHPGGLVTEGVRLGMSSEVSAHIVDTVLSGIPDALELARQDIVDIPGGRQVADTVIRNLRSLSPLYPDAKQVMLSTGPSGWLKPTLPHQQQPSDSG